MISFIYLFFSGPSLLALQRGNVETLIFITVDHGVVSEPHQLMKRKIPAGYFDKNIMITELKEHLMKEYNFPSIDNCNECIANYSNNQRQKQFKLQKWRMLVYNIIYKL